MWVSHQLKKSFVGGKRPGGPCECLHLDLGPSPRKDPSSAMKRILLSMDIAEDKGDNLPLVVTHYVVPQSRKSTIAGKDSGEKGGV